MKNKEETTVGSLLTEATISLDLRGQTKLEVIDELIGLLDAAGRLLDLEKVRAAVIERERKLSTGLEHGVAVPHGKTDGVDRLVAAFGLKKQPIYFDSADGKPAHLFFMLVSPETVSGPHIRALASIAKFMNRSQNRDRISAASNKTEVLAIFKEMN